MVSSLRFIFLPSLTSHSNRWTSGRRLPTTSCALLLLLLLLSGSLVQCEDVFASSAHLQVLADGERHLVTMLREYIHNERTRLTEITRLLAEVQKVHQAEALKPGHSSDVITGNPLQAFHLIRRFATTWRLIWGHASNMTSFEELKAAVTNLTDFVPADSDLVSAMLSLVRLQRTYGLTVQDMVTGLVAGRQSAPLDQQTVFDIALLCLGNGEPDAAIEWLTHAHNYTSGRLTVPLPSIMQAFGRAHAQKKDFVTALDYIRKALEFDPHNAGYLTDILPPSNIHISLDEKLPPWREHYYELCRQAAYQPQQSTDASLDCRLQSGQTSPLQRHKVEMVHRSPDVFMFHDFITDRESQRLIDMAASKIVRAKIGSTVESLVSEARVGKIAWFYDDDSEILVRRISHRAEDAIGLNMTYPTSEPLQMSNYGLGGHYEPHFDHDEHRYSRPNIAPELEQNGDRMATFMIYLNDVTVGGATVFPKLNIAAKPVKNAAIFWYNYKRSGEMDPLSLHAACPVLIGEKWVANKWIREYGQEFHRPCALEQSA